MYKILLILGSRSDLIKMAPLIFEMSKRGMRDNLLVINCATKNEGMSSTFGFLGISPDFTHEPEESHNHNELSSSYLQGLQYFADQLGEEKNGALMMAMGDTIASFSAALTAYHNHIPFIHLEAGVRTLSIHSNFPQELYRRTISMISILHFAPTVQAYHNLIKEGVDEQRVLLCGNTLVDAIEHIKQLSQFRLLPSLPDQLMYDFRSRKPVLINLQRSENLGANLTGIISAIKSLAREYKDYTFIWLKSPNVSEKNFEELSSEQNIFPVDSLDYPDQMRLYPYLKLIITDSVTMQEEAPSFKVPVLVLRDTSERRESIERGYAFLCGASSEKIKRYFDFCMNHPIEITHNPYGDGKAAERITDFMVKYLQMNLHTEHVGQSFSMVYQ